MSETCSCGASISDVSEIDLIREWRTAHRHDAPPLREGPAGTTSWTDSDAQPDYVPFGFRA